MSFVMTVHPDQDGPKWKHGRMMCRAFTQLPLDVGRVDASIDTQMMTPPNIILVHLAALDNGRNPDIGTLKKDSGDIFS